MRERKRKRERERKRERKREKEDRARKNASTAMERKLFIEQRSLPPAVTTAWTILLNSGFNR